MQSISRLQAELAHLTDRKIRIETEIDVLRGLVRGVATGDISEKVGPAEAIRKVLRDHPQGLSRKALIDRAQELASTDPAKVRKTLDQTIRNLMDKELRKESDLIFFAVGNKNGH